MSDDHLASLQILGSSSNEFKDGVLRTTIKLYEGAHVLTLVEEKLEGDAKQIVASKPGRAWMLQSLRNYEQVSGDKLLRTDENASLHDDDLIEAWSSLGQSYLVGKSKKGAAIGKGGARRIFSDVLKSGMGGAMNAETQFFNAVWRRAAKLSKLKREGKLGADITDELERQLGIDSQTKHETEASKEADAIANEAVYAGGESYSEDNPGPNGETFSLKAPFTPPAFITKKFNERIDHWEKTGDAGRAIIRLGFTSPVLQIAGANAHGVVVPPSLFDKVTSDAHAVPVEALRALPAILADPVAVFQSRSDANSLVVLSEFQEPGRGSVVVTVKLDKSADHGWTVNEVNSMYGRSAANIAEMFSERPLYINPQKSLEWAQLAQKQYPGRAFHTQGKESIPGPDDVVKWAENKLREQGDATHRVRKFTMPSLAGAAATLQGMKQGSKAIDFPAIYAAAKVGQSSHMLPLDSLYAQAVKQRPGLTTVEFGKQVQALYDAGHLYLEPGDSPDSMRAASEKYGLRDSLGIPSMYAGPVSQETFSLAKWSKSDKLSNGFLGTTGWSSFRDGIENIDPSAKGGISTRATSAVTKDAEITSLWRSGFTASPNTKEDARGGEHVIEFRNGRAYKQTHPETFGAKFNPETPDTLAWGTPLEYLQRWRLFNEIFDGADVRFEGVVMHPNGALSLKISQPIIEGPHPGIDQIQATLKKAGWKNTALNTWEKNSSRGKLLMTDAKPENFKVADGVVVPVDVIVSMTPAVETHSIRSGDFSARMAAAFSPFQRSPELRLAIAQVAKARAQRLGAEWIEKAAVLRTAGSIGKERRVREALRHHVDQSWHALPEGGEKLAGGEARLGEREPPDSAQTTIVSLRCALEGREKRSINEAFPLTTKTVRRTLPCRAVALPGILPERSSHDDAPPGSAHTPSGSWRHDRILQAQKPFPHPSRCFTRRTSPATSAACKNADTTTTRCAPAAMTSSSRAAFTPPMQNTGSETRRCTSATSLKPTGT